VLLLDLNTELHQVYILLNKVSDSQLGASIVQQ